ncbi:uncharacterized protein PV07_07741 [Cladophialophora immunda]|uniref:Amidohydrolase-related domain-containing protein n=1 Tax=Cladophialophora immunda TaxID=569365 RepID=A0A0D2ASG8_9EURO|nr:uncharacterized protein PV07_07741 [Cladophialophora immunda]KIW28057.1 hypothetical protein PV07_07741 [Cladophialophora immunda]OQV10728.1 hypothetical protein CLAIMM_14688 [Cladophialophora immunda]
MASDMNFPIVDVWANPFALDGVPEAQRLFQQSHADPDFVARRPTPQELVAMMDSAGVSQICLASWRRPGKVVFSNDQVAEFTRAYPDRIFGLASVDLLDPVNAVKELEHYVVNEGFKGLRVVPWLWGLPPTDAHYWPLYVKCIELDIPFCTQVGHTGPLCPSETGRPIPYIDTIALKFPQLKIICGHIGYPWTAEMVAVAWKHENVYIDTSAYLPKYYPPELITFANTTGRKKVMFGTNFPQLTWDACVDSVKQHLLGEGGFRREVVAAFMGGNARRVLKLDAASAQKAKASL